MALEELRPETDAGDGVEGISGAEDVGGISTQTITADSVKRYPVAPGHRVNVRSGPGTNYRLVKVLAVGARVPINCQKPGERVSGPYGTTNVWDCIANGQFVSDAYVQTGSDGYVTIRCT
ncbi:peptidase [Streptomyces sp. NPDC020965]|uniref:peptidase n=1 Tax=Streptomyces sp. NPDC020965 TaxID=3365105 RepID=UPI0037B3B43E